MQKYKPNTQGKEEYRAGKDIFYRAYPKRIECICCQSGECDCEDLAGTPECENSKPECENSKPEGIATEMADCLIRIMDWAASEGIDLDKIVRAKMDYNKGREYRHGGKRL